MLKKPQSLFIFSIMFLFTFFFISCGDKKTETTDTEKKDNKTQNQQMDTTNKTQSIDTTKPKTDTSKVMHKDDSKGKETDIIVLETSMGNITIELFSKDAPNHAKNFKKLVKEGFYDGTSFHRVIAGFMIQAGDPNSKDNDKSNDGLGGPGYTIPAEIKQKHILGSVAAARLGDAANPKKESSGSQFYIVTGEASHLDGEYTVFGKVIAGMDIASKIEKVNCDARDNPIEKVTIKKAYFGKK